MPCCERGGEGDRLLHRARLERRHHRRVDRRVRVDRVRVGRRRTCPTTPAPAPARCARRGPPPARLARRDSGTAWSRYCCATYCRFWSIVSLTVAPLLRRLGRRAAARVDVAEVVDGVGHRAVAAGQHVVVLRLDAGRAGAVGVHGADDVRRRSCRPGTAAGSWPGCRCRAAPGPSPAARPAATAPWPAARTGPAGPAPREIAARVTREQRRELRGVAIAVGRLHLLRVGGDVLGVGGVGQRRAVAVEDRAAQRVQRRSCRPAARPPRRRSRWWSTPCSWTSRPPITSSRVQTAAKPVAQPAVEPPSRSRRGLAGAGSRRSRRAALAARRGCRAAARWLAAGVRGAGARRRGAGARCGAGGAARAAAGRRRGGATLAAAAAARRGLAAWGHRSPPGSVTVGVGVGVGFGVGVGSTSAVARRLRGLRRLAGRRRARGLRAVDFAAPSTSRRRRGAAARGRPSATSSASASSCGVAATSGGRVGRRRAGPARAPCRPGRRRGTPGCWPAPCRAAPRRRARLRRGGAGGDLVAQLLHLRGDARRRARRGRGGAARWPPTRCSARAAAPGRRRPARRRAPRTARGGACRGSWLRRGACAGRRGRRSLTRCAGCARRRAAAPTPPAGWPSISAVARRLGAAGQQPQLRAVLGQRHRQVRPAWCRWPARRTPASRSGPPASGRPARRCGRRPCSASSAAGTAVAHRVELAVDLDAQRLEGALGRVAAGPAGRGGDRLTHQFGQLGGRPQRGHPALAIDGLGDAQREALLAVLAQDPGQLGHRVAR